MTTQDVNQLLAIMEHIEAMSHSVKAIETLVIMLYNVYMANGSIFGFYEICG